MDSSLSGRELTKMLSLFGLPPLDIKTPARRTILPVSALDTLCLGSLRGRLGHPLDSLTWTFSLSFYSSARSACVPVCHCTIQNVY